MPFALQLPTTSSLSFQAHLRCCTHPSLLFRATAARNLVRARLKTYKHLAAEQRVVHLAPVAAALYAYVPFLFALNSALSSSPVATDEEVDIVLVEEIHVQWRSLLIDNRVVGIRTPKINAQGLDAEIAFTLSTLAATLYLLAKSRLRGLYDATSKSGALSSTQRVAVIAPAMSELVSAHAIYHHIATSALSSPLPDTPADISESVASALASLALSEATLLSVLRDDPYSGIVAMERNVHDTDWMITAPKIPKVRAHLLARICAAAADHADSGFASVNVMAATQSSTERKSCEGLAAYLNSLKNVCVSKACRFEAISAESDDATGKAIGWLHAALTQLGMAGSIAAPGQSGKQSRITGLTAAMKRVRLDKHEDRRLEKDGDWGSDAGRLEELRVVEMLLAKWQRLNDTVAFQQVEHVDQLMTSLPSGREYHVPKPWLRPSLSSKEIASMRGPQD